MRLTGSQTLHAPVERVWAALTDPAVISQAIPGCERLESLADGSARLTVTAAVASTTAAYSVQVTSTSSHPTDSFTLTVEAKGEPGSLTATLQVRLAPDDAGTQLTYQAEAEPTGQLAAVGQALLSATAARLAKKFVEALDNVLAHHPEQTATAGAGGHPGGAAGVSSPPPAHTPRVSGTTVDPPTDSGQPAASPGAAPPAHTPRVSGTTVDPPTDSGQPAASPGAAPPATRPAGPERAAAQGATMLGRAAPGKGFAPGVLVGAVVGVAAAKLAGLLARRNR